MAFWGLFSKEKKETLNAGLEKTRQGFFSKLTKALLGKTSIDDDVLDRLEEILVTSDVGVKTTLRIIDRIRERAAKDKFLGTAELNLLLKDEIISLMAENILSGDGAVFTSSRTGVPYVILVVGVNGVGKTTSIGKLAWQLRKEGKKVLLGAADTFRAAAIDQLETWAGRSDAAIVKHKMGSDPAAVAFEAVSTGIKEHYDVVIIDTAGRLHNKIGLMDELSKIKRVIKKVVPEGPDEVLLVLDASTGQNAFEQCRHFIKATEVSGLILTKLDGTAKGGVVIGISDEFSIPVRFIGVGEKPEQLQVFNREEFVDSLFAGSL